SFLFYIGDEEKRYRIRLDPSRYTEKYKDGKKYYYDKVTKTIIPEDVFQIMFDELITQPINKPNISFDELYTILLQVRERIQKTLYQGFELDEAIMPSEDFLKDNINKNMRMIILYVDIVGSTKLSQTLSPDKLATLIKIFAQEMSYLVSAYNGYILKYAGDSVIAFFPIQSDPSSIARDAVNCARSMVNIVRYAINPVITQHDYPEIQIKIGMDLGENQIVSIGKNLDIIGYTMSIAAKIVEFAKAWRIIIGKWVYDALDDDMKRLFKKAKISKNLWNYRDSKEGKYYPLYILEKRIVARRL
ncbi:MAG: adenylate/guanylate cyclase domain-containing protein, partial [Candidatus Nitrosothermus koennekii]